MANKGDIKHSFWTMSSEKIPWTLPEWRTLSPEAQALYYSLSHGPHNGKSCANLTTGINIALLGILAAELGWEVSRCKRSMVELEEHGFAEHDERHGLTLLPHQVEAASNASHVKGILGRIDKKLPESPIREKYLSLLETLTLMAAERWEKDGELAASELAKSRNMHHVQEEEEDPFEGTPCCTHLDLDRDID